MPDSPALPTASNPTFPAPPTPTPPSPASAAATALLTGLIQAGLTDLVLAPGSRSQALALAAAALERAGSLQLHVRIDERVAGFTALGLAQETGRPVAVAVTSGTAVAELHPAVLEAHHAGVPLLLLTADRPAELHGIGANQTTVQAGMFAAAVRAEFDVAAPGTPADALAATQLADRAFAVALGSASTAPGPVHLNLAYREPLSGVAPAVELQPTPVAGSDPADVLPIEPGPRTVVVAGDKAGERAEAFARDAGVPLLAEVSSGARFGPMVVGAYRPLLDDPELGGRIERVVVFGHPTLSRQVPALLAGAEVEVVLVGPAGGEWFDPTDGRALRTGAVRATAPSPDRTWLGAWITASRGLLADSDDPPYRPPADDASPRERGAHARAELAAVRAPVTRRALVEAVWRATWPHDRLVFGASRLIREADAVVPGKRIRVVSNRGLAGIDGTISTAIGVALGAARSGRGGRTRVLLGDLTLLHDAGALLATPGEPVPRLQVIVGNDGGGTIFDSLEVAATAPPDDFRRVLTTPRPADLSALAAAYGWSYRRVTTRGELDAALITPAPGRELVEVPLPA
ncbi:2-succinyl-5-enolpyruvyl-6-hydroxy-3-cyclohexene-1-carboxylic-acid synthase [uncultured Amnibacterium sp.]|uniref:2-succinyl-5-enolpyruvyl-6-hydroxy-3- cyclohexene-1-carboxylic-acid synthase n=1 Tax=uncultured Amnibacterium sp. TaxID=1631851 RepID=UPI0035CAE443